MWEWSSRPDQQPPKYVYFWKQLVENVLLITFFNEQRLEIWTSSSKKGSAQIFNAFGTCWQYWSVFERSHVLLSHHKCIVHIVRHRNRVSCLLIISIGKIDSNCFFCLFLVSGWQNVDIFLHAWLLSEFATKCKTK